MILNLPIWSLHSKERFNLRSLVELLTSSWVPSARMFPERKKQQRDMSYGTPGRPSPGSCPAHVMSNHSDLPTFEKNRNQARDPDRVSFAADSHRAIWLLDLLKFG